MELKQSVEKQEIKSYVRGFEEIPNFSTHSKSNEKFTS